MNSLQIEYYVNNDPAAATFFKGVFARDELEDFDYPASFIINTDKRNDPGEHWIAAFFDKAGNGEYFDSFGLSPMWHGLDNFMDKNSRYWIYNKKTLQSPFSLVCGQYCIYYLLFRSRGLTLRKIVSAFSDKLADNDRAIIRFFKELS